jgi:TolB-like protein
MQRIRQVAFVLALGVWALPAAAQQPKPNDPQQAKLAAKLAANTGSAAANRDLGVWYYKANRFAEARVPLDMARKIDPRDGVAALYAGLAAEQVKDYAAAKDAYNSYLSVGKTARVRKDIAARLVVVTRLDAQAAAKAAVANEARIAQVQGSPTTVAVLPFTTGGTNPDIQPLQVGLADLMITDLAKVKRVTVVERDKIQALADEIALAKTGNVDQTTAVRAGKLIQAGSIVKGSLVATGGTTVTMTSEVVSTQTSATVGTPVTDPNKTLDQVFAMEKDMVNGTFKALGVTLTPREQQDVDRRPTTSYQALLAYGRGLMAQDAGRLDEAARFFESARSADPGFGAALAHAQSAAAAQTTTTVKIEASLKGTTEGATVSQAATGSAPAVSSVATTLSTVIGDVNPTTTNTVAATNSTTSSSAPPTTRPAAAEATGTDQPAPRTGEVTIVIRKP